MRTCLWLLVTTLSLLGYFANSTQVLAQPTGATITQCEGGGVPGPAWGNGNCRPNAKCTKDDQCGACEECSNGKCTSLPAGSSSRIGCDKCDGNGNVIPDPQRSGVECTDEFNQRGCCQAGGCGQAPCDSDQNGVVDACYLCDGNGDGTNDTCYQCDSNQDGTIDHCYLCDKDNNGKNESCYGCDFDGDGKNDYCIACDNNNDGKKESCYACDANADGKNDYCLTCDNDHDGLKESCHMCDSNQDGKVDTCYLCDSNNDNKKDTCYLCDSNNDSKVDSCYLCDSDNDSKTDTCYLCDSNNDNKKDTCYLCDSNNDSKTDTCYLCDSNQDTVLDTCYLCDNNADGVKEGCFSCDTNDDGKKDECKKCPPNSNGHPTKCYSCESTYRNVSAKPKLDTCPTCDDDRDGNSTDCLFCDYDNDRKPDACKSCDKMDDANGVDSCYDCNPDANGKPTGCSTKVVWNEQTYLITCPNGGTLQQTKVTAPTNGCSVPQSLLTDLLLRALSSPTSTTDDPCGLGWTSFLDACNTHDIAYAKCNINGNHTRSDADFQLSEDMDAACSSHGPGPVLCNGNANDPTRIDCHALSSAYHVAVATAPMHNSQWLDSQKRHCACCTAQQ